MSEDIRPAPDARLPGSRWHDLDAVRAFALLLGVALHGVMSFMSPRVWLIADTHTAVWADGLFYVIHSFRMTLFFVLAGFFARLMLQKKGVAAFVGNRLKRIAVPLVVAWPLVMVSIVVMLIVGNAPAPGAPPVPPPPAPALSVASFPLTHLWFLYALLILYTGAVGTKLLTDLLHIGGGLGRMLDVVVRSLTRVDLITVVLIAPVAIAFYTNTHWMMWFGVATPDTGLIPNAMAVAGFMTAFTFGWWLNRSPDLLDHLARRIWSYGLTAIIGTWWCLHVAGVTPALVPVDGHAHPLYALIYPATSWAWTLALIGAAHRFLTRESPVLRYLSDASYWIYLVHVPVILVLQYGLKDIPGPVVAKYWGVVFGTAMFGLFTYAIMVRYTFIGTILNGRKRRARRGATQTQEARV